LGLVAGENVYRFGPNTQKWIDPLGLCKKKIASVKTDWGDAEQSYTPKALASRKQVNNGATLYRTGTMGISDASEAQFWALEHPNTPGYAQRYGIPPENVARADFIETATLKPGTSFVTRQAPPMGTNPGGGIEVVVPRGGVNMTSFSTGGL
jgi:hypothetical protein